MTTETSIQAELIVNNRHRLPIQNLMNLGRDCTFPGPTTDPEVSDRHCRIEKKDEGFFIRDFRSESGTFLNDTRINEAWLKDGDEIRIGNYRAIFSIETQSQANSDPWLLSKNLIWKDTLQKLPLIAQKPYPVLLLGPSGTGKEVLAAKIHQYSDRNQGPFVSVNCSALTETLVESELFGHVKGSFTGAIGDRKGAFESARGGTLFLDEIGDLPYSLQSKLLRALENSEIRPVGSDRTVKTDVRIVAATHQNLSSHILQGSFRQDLYYRLNVVSITPPSLKDRLEDFDDILYQFAKEMRVRFSFSAIQRLKKHSWPGNIRELKNMVARASAFFPKTLVDVQEVEHLLNQTSGVFLSEVSPDSSERLPIIKEVERQMIIKSLITNHGNQRRAAVDLGMPKSTLHDRIRTYQIDPRSLGNLV